MARPLRVEYKNACYHVINRGNRREKIFNAERDYQLFLSKLTEYSELYDVEIHSYCLMPNHFHLQLRTKHANLGKFMQSFLTSFTLVMNRRYEKSGHLFQGRYRAELVESEKYKNKLSRYIHLNPVKVKSLENHKLKEKKQYLRDFKWSSYRAYIGLETKPSWLIRNHVLSSWGRTAKEKLSNYRKYVEEGISVDNTRELESVMPGIIGSDSFKDKIIKKYLVRNLSDIDGREQPELQKINTLSVEEVIAIVSENIKLDPKTKWPKTFKKKVSMFMAVKHCRKKESLMAIAKKFSISISGLNMAVYRFKQAIDKDKKIRQMILNINKTIERKCNNV